MKYKFFATDFDDTLLSTKGTVSARTLKAISEYKALGGKFVLCSGRMFQSIRREALSLGISGDVICYNGAAVGNIDTGEIYSKETIKLEVALEIIKELESEGRLLHLYLDDTLYIEEKSEYTDFYCESCKVGYVETHCSLYEFAKNRGQDVDSMLLIDTPENITEAYARFSKKANGKYMVTQSGLNLLDFVSPNASKGNAVRLMCEKLGVKREECVCCGDSPNDISMIEYAGLGIAVENARDIVKESSDYVTNSCDEDGVGKVLEKVIKGEDFVW